MSVLARDAEATADTLSRWLARVAGVHDPEVTGVTIPSATGWSNETILFDGTWGHGEDRRSRPLVARIAPSGHRVFPEDSFLRQYAVMDALAVHTDVPMARVHWLETDPSWFGQPFWIMERIPGDIAGDAPPYAAGGWLHDAAPAEQARAWWAGVDAMAAVHAVDPAALALPDGLFADTDDPLGWQLDHWEGFLAWAEDGTAHPLAREALAELRRSRPGRPHEGPCLVWGDARLSNLIYRDFEVVAVLDWEMCSIGDPLLDLGWWLFSDRTLTEGAGLSRLEGFPSAADTAARWATATGRSAAALDYFVLFAGLRFTVIMLRMGKLLTGMGLVPPEFAADNLVSQGLARLMARR